MQLTGFPQIFVPHSQWAALLALTGWFGMLAFVWTGLALIRRSREVPDPDRWLHPLLLAALVSMAVQAFGWDTLFTMTPSLGFYALLIAVRFGLQPRNVVSSKVGDPACVPD
jgi:hypothetical protein